MSTSTHSDQPVAGRKKPVVAVVFGGRSSEHAVSCATAASVLQAIDRDRFDVIPIGVATDGRWLLLPDDPEPLRLSAGRTPSVEGDTAALLPVVPGSRDITVTAPGEPPRALGRVDVVLHCCTVRSGRTAPCKACSNSRTCPTSAPGSPRPR